MILLRCHILLTPQDFPLHIFHPHCHWHHLLFPTNLHQKIILDLQPEPADHLLAYKIISAILPILFLNPFLSISVKASFCCSFLSFLPVNDHLSSSHKPFSTSISSIDEPEHFCEAVECSHWWNAIIHEIAALELNQTWSLVDLPHGKQPIGLQIGLLYINKI